MASATKRVVILVKAYPQPSNAYGETVCCAGVTEAGEFVRLYPIRFRRLSAAARFDRYDTLEVKGERPRDDHRPESFHVDEDSIRVVQRGSTLSPEAKARLWVPQVSENLDALREANKTRHVSLGIVKPDEGSVRFGWQKAEDQDKTDREISAALTHQASLIEEPLKQLAPPEYAFEYSYTSAGHKSRGKIHDWEVQATYRAYKAKYGAEALAKMKEAYERIMPSQNLHLFLGTMKAHPASFIIVGLLRTKADVESIGAQQRLL